MLFSSDNLPYWIFLGTGVLLFLFMIVFGGEGQDIDADVDVDVDIDADVDVDIDTQFSIEQLLAWVGVGSAPLILLLAIDLSLWGVLGWMLNVWLKEIFPGNLRNFLGIIVLFGSLILSLFIGGWIAQPIGRIFAEFTEDTSSDRLIGCLGTVSSSYIPRENLGKIGQVDVLDTKRNRLTISAVIPEWGTIAPQRGEQVILIELKSQIYVVIAKDSPDEDRWLSHSRHKN